MRRTPLLIALAAAALAAACDRDPHGDPSASIDRAIAEAKEPAPIPGAGVTATTPQTGSTTRGTENSDTSIGAPRRGTTGANAHGGG